MTKAIAITSTITKKMIRETRPSPGEIPSVWEATPVAKGLTVEAMLPTEVPTRARATATIESKPQTIR